MLAAACAVAVAALCSAQTARADTVTYTADGYLEGKEQKATAVFSLEGNVLHLTLTNNSDASSIIDQEVVLGGVSFSFAPGVTLTGISASGQTIDGATFQTISSPPDLNSGWGFGSTGDNSYVASVGLQLQQPHSLNGSSQDQINYSLLPTGVSVTHPTGLSGITYTYGSVDLTIQVDNSISSVSSIGNVVFLFGTGDDAPIVGDPTPLPASLGNAALLMALFGGGYILYKKQGKASVA